MPKTNRIKKYILPMLCAIAVMAVLGAGVVYIRSYMEQQTVQEKSSQLEEIIAQIRVNLEYGLENHWNLLAGIEAAVKGTHYDSEQELYAAIDGMQKEFRTDLYGCRMMLLDSMGMACLDEGRVGIWDDIDRIADGQIHHTFVSDTSNVDGTYLIFAKKMEIPITVGTDEKKYTHLVMLKDIVTLKK